MTHECCLYDGAGRLVQTSLCQSWKEAEAVLSGWNNKYGEGFTIWYKRK